MHISVQRLNTVKDKVKEIFVRKQLKINPEIIAVTKTFSINQIIPLLEVGHIHFGENKVQEAENKWSDMKNKYKDLQLHMLGKLQSNKAKKAIKLFDYIHSLDNVKLAVTINKFEKELNKKVKLFIQVNIGEENQKTGVALNELNNFYNYCVQTLSLNVIGLMCLPPINADARKYFEILKKKSEELNLPDLSMGMSNDFEQALLYGSTYLRIGSAILGERKI